MLSFNFCFCFLKKERVIEIAIATILQIGRVIPIWGSNKDSKLTLCIVNKKKIAFGCTNTICAKFSLKAYIVYMCVFYIAFTGRITN